MQSDVESAEDATAEDVTIAIPEPSTSQANVGDNKRSERKTLVSSSSSSQKSYCFLKLKRRKTDDATDICEVERNGVLVAVTACKSSSEFGNNFFRGAERRLARHFEYSIVEPFGDEILTVKGHQNPCCCNAKAVAVFTKGREVKGKIIFPGNDNIYEVQNGSGETMFRIVSSVSRSSLACCPCRFLHSFRFRTLKAHEDREIGEIRDRWNGNSISYLNGDGDRFGFSFPEDLTEDQQWILLASSLLLRWQFWRPVNNGLWCLIYFLILSLILFGVGLVIPLII